MSEYNAEIAKDDTHVYCTNCVWLKYENDAPVCKYENGCDIWDPEDSKSLSDRPYYKPVASEGESEG